MMGSAQELYDHLQNQKLMHAVELVDECFSNRYGANVGILSCSFSSVDRCVSFDSKKESRRLRIANSLVMPLDIIDAT